MRAPQYQNRSQLKLQLAPPAPKPLDGVRPKGVVETLADLLLEAVGATMVEGGVDDDQNHA